MKMLYRISLSLAAALLLLLGCGGGGGGSTPPAPVLQAPSALTYSTNPAVYIKGTAVSANTPSSGGGAVASYGVSPSLPAGLSLNTSTGVITGTPTAVTAQASYTVTATNTAGSTSVGLSITVNDVPLTNLIYSNTPMICTVGVVVTPNNPSNSGGVAISYRSSPPLPTGLELNPSSGVITGTPTIVGTAGSYVITAANSAGETSVAISITVVSPPTMPIINSPTIVTASQTGYIASITAQASSTYFWTITNGAITSGIGTTTIIFTAGNTGPVGLSCVVKNAAGNSSAAGSASATVVAKPVISKFIAASPTISVGTGTVLSWTVTGFTSIMLDQGIGNVSNFTTKNIAPNTTTTYTLTVTNDAGTSVQSQVTVTVIPMPHISSFSASRTSVAIGGSTYLMASFTGGSGAISPGNLSITSDINLNITNIIANQTFQLTVTNLVGDSVTANVTVITVPNLVPGYFTSTGSLIESLGWHSATRVPDGRVLMVGNKGSYELYNPLTKTFTLSGSMGTSRDGNAAVLLSNGTVLVAGGILGGSPLNSAVVFDPSNNSTIATGAMRAGRANYTATLLPTGKVLLAGGGDMGSYQNALASAELYDPSTGIFTATGSMSQGRTYHTATLLPNGKVLIVGGYFGGITAELYDPSTGTFSLTASMANGRTNHSASLLPNGKVLIAGGYYNATAELYDPSLGTFAPTGSMGADRWLTNSTLLPNGKVLIAGGYTGSELSSADLYDPSTGTFAPTGSLVAGRYQHTGTLLLDGTVLISGGVISNQWITKTEIFDPENITPGFPNPAYNSSVYTFSVGVPTLPVVPSLVGSASWSISPSLPNGLVLNPDTGTITGTPTTTDLSKSYVVTASNGTNTTSVYLWISVNP